MLRDLFGVSKKIRTQKRAGSFVAYFLSWKKYAEYS